MKRLREQWNWPTALAPVAFGVAMSLVIASCARQSDSLSGPSANGSFRAGAIIEEEPSPTPEPTPEPTPDPTGRFTGGGFQLTPAKVTRGFTIHCDLLLSNNLEINWDGNQFHMTEHLTTVACTDDDDILQPPPAAPVDTIVGVGTGRYNGVDGYTIEFTLVDGGEPGGVDMAALRIFNASGNVLNIPLSVIDGGNIQAHFDQPHK